MTGLFDFQQDGVFWQFFFWFWQFPSPTLEPGRKELP